MSSSEATGVTRVVVVGASGFGRESLDVLEAMIASGEAIEVLGVVDDGPSEANLARLADRGVEHLGTLDAWLAQWDLGAKYVVGVGDPQVRSRLVGRLEDAGLRPFTAVHPSAVVGSLTRLGEGVVICAGAVVSTNVTLGRHVHINPNATIGHDAVLDEFVSVNPSATVSGEVVIGEQTLVGAGAIVLQGLSVGSRSVIGAGAVVTRDVPDGVVVTGVPGRWRPVVASEDRSTEGDA